MFAMCGADFWATLLQHELTVNESCRLFQLDKSHKNYVQQEEAVKEED